MFGKFLLTALAATSVLAVPPLPPPSPPAHDHPIPEPPLDFQIISSNVRVDTNSRFDHELAWSIRKEHQISTLKEQSQLLPTLIGLQEIKKNQLDDVIAGLNANQTTSLWSYYGVGRDDGVEKGEYAAVIYDTYEWEFINGTYKWLSETPDVPSKSWGANNIRIVTITELKHRATGRSVNFLNTHYDHISQLAREQSSYLILEFIDEIPNDYETYLCGDFNSISTDLSYTTLVQGLKDTREIAFNKLSQVPTYTGFEPGDNQTVIDFVWSPYYSNQIESDTIVRTYNVIDTWVNNTDLEPYRFSDHRPVVVEILLK